VLSVAIVDAASGGDSWRRLATDRDLGPWSDAMNQPVSNSGRGGNSGARLGAGAIASLSGAGLLVVFMLQNRAQTNLRFLWWGFTWPLWLLILVSAVFGAVLWLGLGVLRRHRRRKERRQDRRG
jgi:uncharacterized integral membrane protein